MEAGVRQPLHDSVRTKSVSTPPSGGDSILGHSHRPAEAHKSMKPEPKSRQILGLNTDLNSMIKQTLCIVPWKSARAIFIRRWWGFRQNWKHWSSFIRHWGPNISRNTGKTIRDFPELHYKQNWWHLCRINNEHQTRLRGAFQTEKWVQLEGYYLGSQIISYLHN